MLPTTRRKRDVVNESTMSYLDFGVIWIPEFKGPDLVFRLLLSNEILHRSRRTKSSLKENIRMGT